MKQSYILVFFFFIFFFVLAPCTFAATLNFDPATFSTEAGKTFNVDVKIDAGSDQIAGTDIYVNYDPSMVELQTVSMGSYFPKTQNVPSSGRVYIYGVIENQGDYKTGAGTMATLYFKSLKAGDTTVSFDCDSTKTDSSKIVKNDINATNVINCTGNGTFIVTATAPAATTQTATATTQLLQTGTLDSVVNYTMIGVVLLGIGAAMRFLI